MKKLLLWTVAFGLLMNTSHAQQKPAAEAAAAKQQQIALTQAQIDKFTAQAQLLETTLNGITEFRQWVQIERQLHQAELEAQHLNAPPAVPEKKNAEVTKK